MACCSSWLMALYQAVGGFQQSIWCRKVIRFLHHDVFCLPACKWDQTLYFHRVTEDFSSATYSKCSKMHLIKALIVKEKTQNFTYHHLNMIKSAFSESLVQDFLIITSDFVYTIFESQHINNFMHADQNQFTRLTLSVLNRSRRILLFRASSISI